MTKVDRPYWMKRAAQEIDAFKAAKSPEASRAHYELARLYFSRAGHQLVELDITPDASSNSDENRSGSVSAIHHEA